MHVLILRLIRGVIQMIVIRIYSETRTVASALQAFNKKKAPLGRLGKIIILYYIQQYPAGLLQYLSGLSQEDLGHALAVQA